MSAEETSMAEKLATELKRNRDLTRKLYTLRGEVPPNDAGCAACPYQIRV